MVPLGNWDQEIQLPHLNTSPYLEFMSLFYTLISTPSRFESQAAKSKVAGSHLQTQRKMDNQFLNYKD